MAISIAAAATFEPSAPPQLPLATAFTELSYNPPPTTTITAFEELPSQAVISSRARTPPDNVSRHSSPDDVSSTKSSPNSGTSSCAHDTWDSEEGKIAKPGGEPGRPASGGYNLADALSERGWDAKAFKRLKVSLMITRLTILCLRTPQSYVHYLVDKYLDTKQCYTCQDPKLLRNICEWVCRISVFLRAIHIITSIL